MLLTSYFGLKKPEGTDTVNIADFNYNADSIDAHLNTLGTTKAPLANPTFTGIAAAATATAGTNTTQLATTAFVTAAIVNKTSVTGNAGTATKLEAARNIALTGGVTGNANFDGSGNISIAATVTNNSHSHVIGDVSNLQAALNSKQDAYNGKATDANAALTQGIYSFETTCINLPISGKYGVIKSVVSDGGTHNNISNWIWQTVHYTDTTCNSYKRQKVNNEAWTPWEAIHVNQSNPNLLINGDFQVWQRGTSFTIDKDMSKYCADRYMVAAEGITSGIRVEKDPLGLRLIVNSNDANTPNLRSYIEMDEVRRLIGKTLTFSSEYKSEYSLSDNWENECKLFTNIGALLSVTTITSSKTVLANGYAKRVHTFRIDSIADTATSFHIQFFRGLSLSTFGYHVIKYLKLEVGQIATPFSPRPYAEELALCQRYYFKNKWKTLKCADVTTTDIRTCEYNFPVKMRVQPTINNLITQPVSQAHTFNFATNYINPTTAQIWPSPAGVWNDSMCCFSFKHAMPQLDYILEIFDNSYEFDAEIY